MDHISRVQIRMVRESKSNQPNQSVCYLSALMLVSTALLANVCATLRLIKNHCKQLNHNQTKLNLYMMQVEFWGIFRDRTERFISKWWSHPICELIQTNNESAVFFMVPISSGSGSGNSCKKIEPKFRASWTVNWTGKMKNLRDSFRMIQFFCMCVCVIHQFYSELQDATGLFHFLLSCCHRNTSNLRSTLQPLRRALLVKINWKRVHESVHQLPTFVLQTHFCRFFNAVGL